MPNPLEGVDQSNDPYIIVSSDTHAGLYVEDYRAYLESSVHAEFDEWLQTRHEHRAMVEEMNGEYVEQWEGENEWGLQGAYDPEIRDKALDAAGIAVFYTLTPLLGVLIIFFANYGAEKYFRTRIKGKTKTHPL